MFDLKFYFIYLFVVFTTVTAFGGSPYDHVIVGFDNDINVSGDNVIIIYNRVMIQEHDRFSIGNFVSDNGELTTYNDREVVSIDFTYIGNEVIPANTLMELRTDNKGGTATVTFLEMDVSERFIIKAHKDKDLISLSGEFLSIYSGEIWGAENKSKLIGHYIDAISIGVSIEEISRVKLPLEISNRNLYTTSVRGPKSGTFNFEDCDLCEILQALLDKGFNWTTKDGFETLIKIIQKYFPDSCKGGDGKDPDDKDPDDEDPDDKLLEISNGEPGVSSHEEILRNAEQSSQLFNRESQSLLEMSLNPNPALDFTDVIIVSKEESPVTYTLYNSSLRRIGIHRGILINGRNSFRLSTTDFSSGFYIVVAQMNNKTITSKLIVTK